MDDHPITNRSPLSALLICGGVVILSGAIGAQAENATLLSVPTEEPPVNEELELLKEEQTVSIATRYEQPISQAPSNVYVITDEDIRHSGATDIPTVLGRVPGLDIMQVSGASLRVTGWLTLSF